MAIRDFLGKNKDSLSSIHEVEDIKEDIKEDVGKDSAEANYADQEEESAKRMHDLLSSMYYGSFSYARIFEPSGAMLVEGKILKWHDAGGNLIRVVIDDVAYQVHSSLVILSSE